MSRSHERPPRWVVVSPRRRAAGTARFARPSSSFRTLTVAVLACIVLPAVISPSSSSGAELELAVFQYGVPGEADLYRDIRDDFQRKNPGLTVRLSMLPWDGAFETLRRMVGPAGSAAAPDVVLVRNDWLPQLAGSLQPLNEAAESRARREYCAGALNACYYGKRLYGIPLAARTQALYYRPDVLRQAKAKAPENWGQLIQVAAQTTSPPDMFGFGIPGAGPMGPSSLFLPMLWCTGARLDNDRGEVVFDVEALHVLSLLCELALKRHGAQPEVLSYTQADLEALFAVGRLAMLVDGPWLAWYLDRDVPDLNYDIAPLPAGTRSASLVSVDLLAMPVNSREPELAARLVRHLSQDRFLLAFAQLGALPAKRSVTRRDAIAKDKRLRPFARALEEAESLPLAIWSQLEPALNRAIYDVLSGRKTPREAQRDFRPPGLRLASRLSQEQDSSLAPPNHEGAGGRVNRKTVREKR
ncbi:MAG: ABC transporter substrate-binding protein [Armatimonadota bacterium]